jgi:hypothetical protein
MASVQNAHLFHTVRYFSIIRRMWTAAMYGFVATNDIPKKVTHFEIDGDDAELGDEENDGRPTQLQGLLATLELVGGEEDTIVSFEDVDGEHAFFRSAELSLVEIPLWAVEPLLTREDTGADESLATSIQ